MMGKGVARRGYIHFDFFSGIWIKNESPEDSFVRFDCTGHIDYGMTVV